MLNGMLHCSLSVLSHHQTSLQVLPINFRKTTTSPGMEDVRWNHPMKSTTPVPKESPPATGILCL